MTPFAQNVKRLLGERNIPQTRLAEYLGVSRQTVNFWIREKCEPSLDHLIRVADFFQVTTDELLGRNK